MIQRHAPLGRVGERDLLRYDDRREIVNRMAIHPILSRIGRTEGRQGDKDHAEEAENEHHIDQIRLNPQVLVNNAV